MKRKKYSLEQRTNYYDKIVTKEFNTGDKKLSKKGEFGISYSQAVERGRPLNYDTLSETRKKGIIAGEKARKKAFNIKF